MSDVERLLDRDEINGLEQWFRSNEDATKIEIVTRPIHTDLAAYNQRERNSHNERAKFGHTRHVARIPPHVWYDLQRRGIAQDSSALKRWLDHSDNKCWRTFPGRVS